VVAAAATDVPTVAAADVVPTAKRATAPVIRRPRIKRAAIETGFIATALSDDGSMSTLFPHFDLSFRMSVDRYLAIYWAVSRSAW
jgi:hypothetical protein